MTDFCPGDSVTFTATGVIESLDPQKGECLIRLHGMSGIPFLLSQVHLTSRGAVIELHLKTLNLLEEELQRLIAMEERDQSWHQQITRVVGNTGAELQWFLRAELTLKWREPHYELDPNA